MYYLWLSKAPFCCGGGATPYFGWLMVAWFLWGRGVERKKGATLVLLLA
jgi:hypothetical protein